MDRITAQSGGKQYVVVTRVTPVRLGGRIMVHAYGPYDRNRAASVSRSLKSAAVRDGYADRSEVSICTMLFGEGDWT